MMLFMSRTSWGSGYQAMDLPAHTMSSYLTKWTRCHQECWMVSNLSWTITRYGLWYVSELTGCLLQNIDGVDYRKNIFLFLSNTGGRRSHRQLLTAGTERGRGRRYLSWTWNTSVSCFEPLRSFVILLIFLQLLLELLILCLLVDERVQVRRIM